MATAPLLLLIVAALPRAEAAPAPSEIAAPAALVRCAALALNDRADLDDEQRAKAPALALAPARENKRPPREPIVQALAPAPSRCVPPALAPRTEPGEARGPPAMRV